MRENASPSNGQFVPLEPPWQLLTQGTAHTPAAWARRLFLIWLVYLLAISAKGGARRTIASPARVQYLHYLRSESVKIDPSTLDSAAYGSEKNVNFMKVCSVALSTIPAGGWDSEQMELRVLGTMPR